MSKEAFDKIAAGLDELLAGITEENLHDEVRIGPNEDELTPDQIAWLHEQAAERRRRWSERATIERLRGALEHATELLVDTWATAMDGDPEKEAAVVDARELLADGSRSKLP